MNLLIVRIQEAEPDSRFGVNGHAALDILYTSCTDIWPVRHLTQHMARAGLISSKNPVSDTKSGSLPIA